MHEEVLVEITTDFADVSVILIDFYEDVYDFDTDTFTTDYKTFINNSLDIDELKYISGTMKSQGSISFRLEEVGSRYIPVPGGKCYDVDNFTWDLTEE